jgi:hypothetical protein
MWQNCLLLINQGNKLAAEKTSWSFPLLPNLSHLTLL